MSGDVTLTRTLRMRDGTEFSVTVKGGDVEVVQMNSATALAMSLHGDGRRPPWLAWLFGGAWPKDVEAEYRRIYGKGA